MVGEAHGHRQQPLITREQVQEVAGAWPAGPLVVSCSWFIACLSHHIGCTFDVENDDDDVSMPDIGRRHQLLSDSASVKSASDFGTQSVINQVMNQVSLASPRISLGVWSGYGPCHHRLTLTLVHEVGQLVGSVCD